MNDSEMQEAELRRLRPTKVPDGLMDRLLSVQFEQQAQPVRRSQTVGFSVRKSWLSWFAPMTAVATAAVALLAGWWTQRNTIAHSTLVARTDGVEISHQLDSSFDAIAQMPGGEPVRFRCREWTDEVTYSDPKTGVEITQSTPRLEVVPVRIETY